MGTCGKPTFIKICEETREAENGTNGSQKFVSTQGGVYYNFTGGDGFSGGGAPFGTGGSNDSNGVTYGMYNSYKGYSHYNANPDYRDYREKQQLSQVGKGSRSTLINELYKIYPEISAGKATKELYQVNGDSYSLCPTEKYRTNVGSGIRSNGIIAGGGAGGLLIANYNIRPSLMMSSFKYYSDRYYSRDEKISTVIMNSGEGFGAGGCQHGEGLQGCIIIDYINYTDNI